MGDSNKPSPNSRFIVVYFIIGLPAEYRKQLWKSQLRLLQLSAQRSMISGLHILLQDEDALSKPCQKWMWHDVTKCDQMWLAGHLSEFGLPVLSSAFGALESHAEINKVLTFQGALQLQRCQRWTACPGNAGVFKTRSPVEDNTSSHGVFDIQLVFKTFYPLVN